MSLPWDARAPIYLIESPSADDLYSGTNEGQSLVSILELANIEVKYFLVTDAERFERALGEIVELINGRNDAEHVLPFIHISAHGSDEGIELTDGECLYWERLSELLRRLHGSTGDWSQKDANGDGLPKCSLSLSSCAAFCSYTKSLSGDMPVQAVLGPNVSVGWCESLLAFSCFYYQTFVRKCSFSQSVKSMNAAVADEKNPVFQLNLMEKLGVIAATGVSQILSFRFPAAVNAKTNIEKLRALGNAKDEEGRLL